MKKKILGVDIGISSVGWGIIDEDDNVIATGVRLFQEGNTKSNEERRTFRGARRLKSRRKIRIKDMYDLLVENNIILKNQNVNDINPYDARLKGLTGKITNEELASALLHIVKRRGSSFEVAGEEVTDGVNPKDVLRRHALELKNRYVVELQLERLKKEGKIRNQENIFKTEDYVKEVKQIFKNQNLTKSFQEKAIAIIERRRHFSEGPGSVNSPSPYGRWRHIDDKLKEEIINNFTDEEKKKYGIKKFTVTYNKETYIVLRNKEIINKKPLNLIDLMRGKCSVFINEFRAPKNSYSSLLFNFLDEINNMKIVSQENRKFSKEEKEKAINVIKENGCLKPNNINGFLKLYNLTIEDVMGYKINDKNNPIITDFKPYETLFKIFKEEGISNLNYEIADKIAEILTNNQIVTEREEQILKIIDNKNIANKAANLTGYNGYHSLSFKAIYLLNEELLNTSNNQQQILTSKSLREEKKITKLELNDALILSSVARRAHREALKVIEELIKEFGNFDRIVIETTREKNSVLEKRNKTKRQSEYKTQKDEAIKLLEDSGFSDSNYSRQTLLKIRLYNEQNGKCAYSGVNIDFGKMVMDPFAYEIDHIIPRSISLDNSLNNRALVLQEVNQAKGNRTPFEYFSSGLAKGSYPINNYNAFKEYVNGNPSYSRYPAKRRNLLNEEDILKYDSLEEFTNRNLVDTSYAARSLMNTLKRYFKANNINTAVNTIRGKQTDMFRGIASGIWNRDNKHLSPELNPFNKDRNYYSHHALDALIIAGLSNQKTLRYLFELETTSKGTYTARKDTGELFDADPTSDAMLMKFLKSIGQIEDNDVRFSWKVDKKINRSFSNQTIYSTRKYNNEHYIIAKYKNIYEIDKNSLSKILEKEKEKLLVYQHDKQTFELIVKAFEQYSHEKYPLKAYMEEHGKIRKNGVGPYVTSLKYRKSRLGMHIEVTKESTKNKKEVLLQISPYRIDIYKDSKNNYKFITIRYADFSKDRKGYFIKEDIYNEKLIEKNISNKFNFLFSIHSNEIISIKEERKESSNFKFIGVANDKTNRIELKSIHKKDDDRIFKSIGRKTGEINKYAVSPAGRISRIYSERLTLVRYLTF